MTTKPRKLHGATIKRLSLDVAENAGWLAARSTLISAASDYIDDGRQAVRYDTVKRGGQEATGPERAALSGHIDDIGIMAGEFMELLPEWERIGRRLRILAVKLAVEWDDVSRAAAEGKARRLAEPAGAGDCANCGRLVSGASRDRLRGGRCDACRKFLERNAYERPKELWASDSIDPQCVAILTRHGQDYRCILAVGHDHDHQFSVPVVTG